MFEVLMYLFNFFTVSHKIDNNSDMLFEELASAGFNDDDILYAFEWLQTLKSESEYIINDELTNVSNKRMFSSVETEKLSPDGRGFLLFLVQTGVITAQQFEQIIDKIVVMPRGHLDIAQLKMVVLMVVAHADPCSEQMSWLSHVLQEVATRPVLH